MTFPSLKVNSRYRPLLTISILLTGLAYLLTPMMMRTIADGIIPTGDFKALLFLVGLLVLVETFGLFAGLIFKLHLEIEVREKIMSLKHYILDRIASKRMRIHTDSFIKVVLRDSKDLAQASLKQRWQLYHDGFVVFLLISAAVLLNFRAGILITIISILTQAANMLMTQFTKQTHQQNQLIELDEQYTLQGWSRNLVKIWDRDEAVESLEAPKAIIQRIDEKGLRLNYFYNMGDLTGKAAKMLTLTCAILMLGWSEAATQSPGMIFALVIIIYRISGPLGRIGKAAGAETEGKLALQRIQRFFSEAESVPVLELRQQKELLGQLWGLRQKKQNLVVFCTPKQASSFGNLIRQWEMCSEPNLRHRVILLDGEEGTPRREDPSDLLIVRFPPKVLDPEFWANSSIQKDSHWNIGFPLTGLEEEGEVYHLRNLEEDTVALQAIDPSAPLDDQTMNHLLGVWRQWSPMFADAERDLERVFRSKLNVCLWWVEPVHHHLLGKIRASIRQFDYYLSFPNKGAYAVLINCDEAGFESFYKRLQSSNPRQILPDPDQKTIFRLGPDPRPLIQGVRKHFISALLGRGLFLSGQKRKAA